MLLYNVATHEQTELNDVPVRPIWSEDSPFVYFEDTPPTGSCRLRIKDRKREHVVSLKALRPVSDWIGLTPDGSLIATNDGGSREIYSNGLGSARLAVAPRSVALLVWLAMRRFNRSRRERRC